MLHKVVRRAIVYVLATKANVYVTVKPLINIHVLVHGVNEYPDGRVAGCRICVNILTDVLPDIEYVRNSCGPVGKSSRKSNTVVYVQSSLFRCDPSFTLSHPICVLLPALGTLSIHP